MPTVVWSVGMDWRERITLDPKILVGKPVVRGTRLSVEFVVGLFGQGWTLQDVLDNYPGLAVEDVPACFAHASDMLQGERI